MSNVSVNFQNKIGNIKPLNGVNSGPKTKVFTYNATDLFLEANIPSSRMHDVEYPYGSGEFVDIHCVFPNFDADVNDPASYDFALTDCYLKATLDARADIFYRLGESIEHAPVNKYIFPPKDYLKWSQICEHIILHYNEGWANGHHWNIKYWEIWNEADGDTYEVKGPERHRAVWAGTKEEFWDFYEVASKYLKGKFPELKIGGPALAARIPWALEFIPEMARRNVPMDFFSWHTYSHKIETYMERTEALYNCLQENRYTETELILDEWNYVESWNHQPRSFRKLVGPTGAAFCGALMVALQHSPNTAAHYFEADVIKEWCGIFQVKDMEIGQHNPKNKDVNLLVPRKPFYAFKAFGKLLALGTEVESVCEEKGLYVCAAKNENEQAVMLVSYHSDIVDGTTEVTLSGLPTGGCKIEVYLTDEGYDEKLERVVECDEETYVLPIRLVDEQVRLIKIGEK